ncbi:hypothetical protein ABZP36_010688 [Zizania latifolia]
MLESAILALWSAVHGWFTPAVLFLVLNLVIGTIAVTSKVGASAAGGKREGDGSGGGGGGGGEQRRFSRVPSMALDRLRSFNMSRLVGPAPAPAPEPAVAGFMDLGHEETSVAAVEEQGEGEREHPPQVERSRSEADAVAELPALPARLRKSASDRSAFAHFKAETEETEAVEARRPATTRELPRRRWLDVSDAKSESSDEEDAGAGEVDARADDFINNFHQQLKLQRIDSFLRYRELIRRGHAAAAGGRD